MVIFLATLFLLPVAALVKFSLFGEIDSSARKFVFEFALAEATSNTFILILVSIFFANIIGFSLSALHQFTNLPFKKALFVLSILPLAIPLYVYAFIYMGAFEYNSTMATFFREELSLTLDPQNILFAGFILSLALSPYAFIFYFSGMLRLNRNSILAAKSIGANTLSILRYVLFPHLRPYALAATVLIALEVICDFGAVSIFNIETYSTVVYGAWESFFSLEAAALLSLAPIAIGVALFYVLEKTRIQSSKESTDKTEIKNIHMYEFNLYQKVLAWSLVIVVLGISILFPILQLTSWLFETISSASASTQMSYALQTVIIATAVAALASILSVCVSLVDRFSRRKPKYSLPLVQLGYALPGSIFAIGCISTFSFLGISHTGTLAILLLTIALTVRFFATSFQQVSKQLSSIPRSFDNATRSLGASTYSVFRFVHLAQLKPTLMIGFLLVFLEAAKEMPITLILRPFGWNTFATKIYELTSEGEWQQAAYPALFLVLLGMGSLVVHLSLIDKSGRPA